MRNSKDSLKTSINRPLGDKIYRFLLGSPNPLTSREIADELGLEVNIVTATLSVLENGKKVFSLRKARYKGRTYKTWIVALKNDYFSNHELMTTAIQLLLQSKLSEEDIRELFEVVLGESLNWFQRMRGDT